MVRGKDLAEKAFCCLRITRGAEHEIQCGAGRVECPVEVVLLLFKLDIHLINTVRIIGRFPIRSTAFIQLGGIGLNPAKDGGMIDGYPAFLHEFFHIPITSRVAQIPADRAEDHLGREMALFERRYGAHARFPVI
jgi:hypothetical protein